MANFIPQESEKNIRFGFGIFEFTIQHVDSPVKGVYPPF